MRAPITLHGAQRLREELEQLKSVKRPAVITAIAEARAHGDLKENAEYHAAREQQGFIEGRIKQLECELSHAQVIDVATLNAGIARRVRRHRRPGRQRDRRRAQLPDRWRPRGRHQAGPDLDLLAGGARADRQARGRHVTIEAPGGSREYDIVGVELRRLIPCHGDLAVAGPTCCLRPAARCSPSARAWRWPAPIAATRQRRFDGETAAQLRARISRAAARLAGRCGHAPARCRRCRPRQLVARRSGLRAAGHRGARLMAYGDAGLRRQARPAALLPATAAAVRRRRVSDRRAGRRRAGTCACRRARSCPSSPPPEEALGADVFDLPAGEAARAPLARVAERSAGAAAQPSAQRQRARGPGAGQFAVVLGRRGDARPCARRFARVPATDDDADARLARRRQGRGSRPLPGPATGGTRCRPASCPRPGALERDWFAPLHWRRVRRAGSTGALLDFADGARFDLRARSAGGSGARRCAASDATAVQRHEAEPTAPTRRPRAGVARHFPPLLRRIYAARGATEHRPAAAAPGELLPPDYARRPRAAARAAGRRDRADSHIVVVGDFDCDGATACAVGVRGLRMLGAHACRYRGAQSHGAWLRPVAGAGRGTGGAATRPAGHRRSRHRLPRRHHRGQGAGLAGAGHRPSPAGRRAAAGRCDRRIRTCAATPSRARCWPASA